MHVPFSQRPVTSNNDCTFTQRIIIVIVIVIVVIVIIIIVIIIVNRDLLSADYKKISAA